MIAAYSATIYGVVNSFAVFMEYFFRQVIYSFQVQESVAANGPHGLVFYLQFIPTLYSGKNSERSQKIYAGRQAAVQARNGVTVKVNSARQDRRETEAVGGAVTCRRRRSSLAPGTSTADRSTGG